MAWAAVAGAGVGLLGSVLGGNAAEDQANANQQNQRALLGQQYGYGRQAMARGAGQLYGGGGLQYLYNTMSPEDFDAQFGQGAHAFQGMNAQQQTAARAGTAGTQGQGDPRLRDALNQQLQEAQRRQASGEGSFQTVRDLQQRIAGLGAAGTSGTQGFDASSLDNYSAQFGGQRGIIGEQQDQATQAEGEGNNVLSGFDQSTGRLNDLYQQTLGDYDTGTNSLLGQYQSNFNDQARRGSGLESMASDWGRGAEESATSDAQRALTGANQVAQGRLAASGLGNSTLVANQLSGNASESARNLANTKLAIQQGRLGAQMGARNQTNQTLGGIQGQQAGAMGQRLAGRTSLQTDNLNMQNSRSNARTGIQDANLNRNIGLRSAPLNTRLAMLQSQIMNPGMNINTSSFYTPSGQGSTQSALGGFLGNIGGGMYGQGLSNIFGNNNQSQAPRTGLNQYLPQGN